MLKNQGNLICADTDLGLPFMRGSVDRLFVNDVFMYLKRKQYLLQEAERVGKQTSLTFLTHIHNAGVESVGQGYGLTDRELKTYASSHWLLGVSDRKFFESLIHRSKHPHITPVTKLIPLKDRSYSLVMAHQKNFIPSRSPIWVERLASTLSLTSKEDPELQS